MVTQVRYRGTADTRHGATKTYTGPLQGAVTRAGQPAGGWTLRPGEEGGSGARQADGQTAGPVGGQPLALVERPVGRRRLAGRTVGRQQIKVGGGGLRGHPGRWDRRPQRTVARRGRRGRARCDRRGGGSRCSADSRWCRRLRVRGPADLELGPFGDRDYRRKGTVVPGRRGHERTRTARAGLTIGSVDHTAAGTDHVPPGYLPESHERPSGCGVVRRARTAPMSSVSNRPVAPHTTSSSRRKNGTARNSSPSGRRWPSVLGGGPELFVVDALHRQPGQRHPEHLLDFTRVEGERQALRPHRAEVADEAVDEGRAADRRERGQLPDDLDGTGIDADFLVGLPQSGVKGWLTGLQAPPGKRHLATVRAQVRRAAGEHDVGFSVVLEQQAKHCGRPGIRPGGQLGRGDRPPGRRGRARLQRLRESYKGLADLVDGYGPTVVLRQPRTRAEGRRPRCPPAAGSGPRQPSPSPPFRRPGTRTQVGSPAARRARRMPPRRCQKEPHHVGPRGPRGADATHPSSGWPSLSRGSPRPSPTPSRTARVCSGPVPAIPSAPH